MKCKQRLCQRNKNLRISGYCSICDNLAEEVKKKYADKEKPSIDTLIEKLQEVEVENLTNKRRLEALENLVSTITESLKKMEAGKDASDREGKTIAIEDVGEVAITLQQRDSNDPRDKQRVKCKICKESFSKNSELENHLVNIHGSKKTHSCENCDKTFLLKWRLSKHTSIHRGNVQICKFYKTGTFCPFEEIGCKFRHEETIREGDNLVGDDISFQMNEEGTDDNIEDEYEETDETNMQGTNGKATSSETETVDTDEEVDLWDGPVPCLHCADFFDMRDKLLEHMKRHHMHILLSQCGQADQPQHYHGEQPQPNLYHAAIYGHTEQPHLYHAAPF